MSFNLEHFKSKKFALSAFALFFICSFYFSSVLILFFFPEAKSSILFSMYQQAILIIGTVVGGFVGVQGFVDYRKEKNKEFSSPIVENKKEHLDYHQKEIEAFQQYENEESYPPLNYFQGENLDQ